MPHWISPLLLHCYGDSDRGWHCEWVKWLCSGNFSRITASIWGHLSGTLSLITFYNELATPTHRRTQMPSLHFLGSIQDVFPPNVHPEPNTLWLIFLAAGKVASLSLAKPLVMEGVLVGPVKGVVLSKRSLSFFSLVFLFPWCFCSWEFPWSFWVFSACFTGFLRIRTVRKILGIFEFFLGVFEKNKEKKDRG